MLDSLAVLLPNHSLPSACSSFALSVAYQTRLGSPLRTLSYSKPTDRFPSFFLFFILKLIPAQKNFELGSLLGLDNIF